MLPAEPALLMEGLLSKHAFPGRPSPSSGPQILAYWHNIETAEADVFTIDLVRLKSEVTIGFAARPGLQRRGRAG